MKNQIPIKLRSAALFTTLIATGTLLGCEAKPARTDAPAVGKIQSLVDKMKTELVLVKGGDFQMGDFGEIQTSEKLPYTSEPNDGPLHKVTLSDFSIAKYKVTLGDYDIYALANGLPVPYQEPDMAASIKSIRAHPKSARFPAGVAWQDARGYCNWLGKQIGRAMDLPTEAEWEYASRARGTLVVFATDNGKEESGRNFPSREQLKKISGKDYGDMPVGMYPPNTLGLYDMAMNGFEWTSDWYAPDYYSHSPDRDPKGPETGSKKVYRGVNNDSTHPAMTFERAAREPGLPAVNGTNLGYGFRCVARQASVK